MLNKLQNEWRTSIIFILVIVMMSALFLSRAILSVSMILFLVITVIHPGWRSAIRNFCSTPLLWGMTILFFIPLVSGLWSEDKEQWLDNIRVKLPLLLLPIAFAGTWQFSIKQWRWLGCVFQAIITISSCWCMYDYLIDPESVNESYLRAQTMITPLENDHVRYSWLVSVAILLGGWILWQDRDKKNWRWYLLLVIITWLIIFLHLLAARTGLFSFYIIVAGIILWQVFTKTKPVRALVMAVILLLLPIAAYYIFPSFQNRVDYTRFAFDYFKKASYLPGSNDAIRVISINAGWSVMNEQPLTGVGFGDILPATTSEYQEHYPGMQKEDKILPGSEWVLYGAGSGWPGLILFGLCMLLPFFTSIKHRIPWFLLCTIAWFSLLFDIGLEVQFGVFAWSFVLLWWWKWLITEKV